MRDKVLVYAIAISVVVHLVAAVVVGRTFAARLAAVPKVASVPQHLEVDLVRDPNEALKPKPASAPAPLPPPKPRVIQPAPIENSNAPTPTYANDTPHYGPRPAAVSHYRAPGNPGGQINTGTPSRNGDLSGMGTGTTRVGYVPSSEPGKGSGSGTGYGQVSHPDPVPQAHDGPGRDAAPIVPARKTVNVKVCEVSGMVAGVHCKRTDTKTYFDGEEPRHTCNICKAPEPSPEPKYVSQVAEKSDPVLVSSSYRDPAIPSSVDEGLSLSVSVSYTVTAEGSVTDVEVTRSSGIREVDRAVIKATSGMRYKPAMQAGVARSVKMTRTYHVRT